jgi:hypothetical protein
MVELRLFLHQNRLGFALIFLLLFLSRKKVRTEGIKKSKKLVRINDVLNLISGLTAKIKNCNDKSQSLVKCIAFFHFSFPAFVCP